MERQEFLARVRYDRDPVTELVVQGTTLLLNISASPYTIDKRSLRFDMLRSIAKSHHRPVIYVNQVGGNDSLMFDGASMALTADGKSGGASAGVRGRPGLVRYRDRAGRHSSRSLAKRSNMRTGRS